MNRAAFATRLSRLRKRLAEEELEGAVVVPGPNLRYFTGVDSLLLERPFMMLVQADGGAHLVAPALEAGPYSEGPIGLVIHAWTDSQGSAGAIKDAASEVKLRGPWGVEGRTPFLFLTRLMDAASPKFVDAEPLLQGLREVKDEVEAELLRKSARILSRSFEAFPSLIGVGKTELEVAREATQAIYDNGATSVDDILVQSGPRTADPHGLPTSRRIGRGEGVIIDVGTTFEGYYADVTRTFSAGASRGLEKVYSKVLEAEESGIAASRAGEAVGGVDRAARGVITRAGLGKYFIHRTGHGLGLEVHEAPYIVEGGKERLKENMCFTVEPGVYIRGKLGVRIEDDVMIQGKIGKALTDTPKEFGWWR
jgi:Xaa-Pro aminopeptidase